MALSLNVTGAYAFPSKDVSDCRSINQLGQWRSEDNYKRGISKTGIHMKCARCKLPHGPPHRNARKLRYPLELHFTADLYSKYTRFNVSHYLARWVLITHVEQYTCNCDLQ